MDLFKKYRRTQIAEMIAITEVQINFFKERGILRSELNFMISISQEDINNGSPKVGDMIARNPKNHRDQWLVAEQYFKDNFESL